MRSTTAVFAGDYCPTEGGFRRAIFDTNRPSAYYAIEGVSPIPADVFVAKRDGCAAGTITQQWSGFAGLVPDSMVRPRAPSSCPGVTRLSLRGKRVALVLTNGSRAAFARMNDFGQRISTWGAAQRRDIIRRNSAALGQFSSADTRDVLAVSVIDAFRRRAVLVDFVADLSKFPRGDAEYALILDVDFDHELDDLIPLLERELRSRGESVLHQRPPAINGRVAWVLLDRQLRIVAESMAPRTPLTVPGDSRYRGKVDGTDKKTGEKLSWGEWNVDDELTSLQTGLRRFVRRGFSVDGDAARDVLASPYFVP